MNTTEIREKLKDGWNDPWPDSVDWTDWLQDTLSQALDEMDALKISNAKLREAVESIVDALEYLLSNADLLDHPDKWRDKVHTICDAVRNPHRKPPGAT